MAVIRIPQTGLDEREIQQLRAAYMSDNTSYMRWSTEIEPKQDVIDNEFLSKHKNMVLFLDKFAPLANFTDPKQGILHKLKLMNAVLAKNAGLEETADETALSAIDDIQISRGDKGFYQKALITQRQELQQEQLSDNQKRTGFWNRLFSKKTVEQKQDQVMRYQQ